MSDPFAPKTVGLQLVFKAAPAFSGLTFYVRAAVAAELLGEFGHLDPTAKECKWTIVHRSGVMVVDLKDLAAINVYEGNAVNLAEFVASLP